MSELKLKPCPFCGGEMNISGSSRIRRFTISHRHLRKCHFYSFEIDWQTVGTLAEAVEAWNRRTKIEQYYEESLLKKHIVSKPIKTNSDKLRQMSDNELAKWLNDNDCYFPIGDRTQYWIDWLKQEEESEC